MKTLILIAGVLLPTFALAYGMGGYGGYYGIGHCGMGGGWAYGMDRPVQYGMNRMYPSNLYEERTPIRTIDETRTYNPTTWEQHTASHR